MENDPYARLASAVSQERLWARHVEMGAIGGTAKGGVNRQALSGEDAAAQTLLASWARARGFTCHRDEIGNLFVRREGTDPGADPVFAGSHLDSQPTGGKYDGAYGVLAAFEVLEALEDLALSTRRPVEAVAWMNEEGSRFSPGAMGSGVFAGGMPIAEAIQRRDVAGVSVAEALEELNRLSAMPPRALAAVRPAYYLEAHIEQGPRLESAGMTIGVVSGIQGIRRYAVEVSGEEAHAGTTPRSNRHDALSAAVAIIAALEDLTRDAEDALRFTVGQLVVKPNSPNTIPSNVRFSIDLRHPDQALLDVTAQRITEIAARIAAERRCGVQTIALSAVAPTHFPKELVDIVRDAAKAEALPSMDMPSGAGHDAMYLNRICPSAMVFVPCLKGVSHNEAESATAADLAAGVRVLARTLVDLANR